ncbi:unnamed protein product [Pleuronectes platessa]|uniref:Uncharacterized protein n=1 Tax=Pleuronectes platessa TaxID=8262 RepID=A0A9N7Y9X5_PLEPL|nr:unnamed protein product [Pleuronectes platessa]
MSLDSLAQRVRCFVFLCCVDVCKCTRGAAWQKCRLLCVTLTRLERQSCLSSSSSSSCVTSTQRLQSDLRGPGLPVSLPHSQHKDPDRATSQKPPPQSSRPELPANMPTTAVDLEGGRWRDEVVSPQNDRLVLTQRLEHIVPLHVSRPHSTSTTSTCSSCTLHILLLLTELIQN